MIQSARHQRERRSRRAFLRTVGAGATALPFYRLLQASAVQAAAPAQRFIGLYAPHGISEPFYNRRAGESDTEFSFSYENAVLQPFDDAAGIGKSFKDKVTVVQGLDLAAGFEKSTNGHKASCVMLTGCAPNGDSTGSESIDQYLAGTQGLGAQTRFASVVLGVGTNKTDSGENISYATGGAPLPKIIDPTQTYNMLFANLVVGSDPAAQAGFEKARLRGQSVIDFLRKDIGRLQTRLAAVEKVKLEQHLSSLRELEKRISAAGGAAPAAGCRMPPAPNPAEYPKVRIYGGGEPYLERITDLQADFLVQAMACDLTRFATLFIGLTEEVHQTVAHQYDGPRGSSTGNLDTQIALAKHNRYFFSKCARLLKGLDDFGILDSTLVYMSSDMGDPALHSLRNIPTVLAGGANGKIKMGRFLSVVPDCPPTSFYCKPPTLTASNHVLVAIAQAFGAPVNSFGAATDPGIITGALPGLLA